MHRHLRLFVIALKKCKKLCKTGCKKTLPDSVNIVGEDTRVNLQDFIRGFEWAIEQDVDIINISLGFSRYTDELRSVINQAIEQCIIIISASGNTQGMNALFPARFENVISVGTINEHHEIISESAIGEIDFVAPGKNILFLTYNGGYDLFHGSSFATAFVTGVVAEYLSQNEMPKIDIPKRLFLDI